MTLPTRFWTTSGVGESDFSELDAIDQALIKSGIGYQNFIPVSSVPPAEEIFPRIDSKIGLTHVFIDNRWELLPISSTIHTVRAINTGVKGDLLVSAIALAKVNLVSREKPIDFVLAYENIGNELDVTTENATKGVEKLVNERHLIVDASWGESGYKTVISSLEVKLEFGCSAVFVVFDPFTYKYKFVTS